MGDTLVTFQGSLIQYGPENDRVYLMKIGPDPGPELVEYLEHLASEGGYSKIVSRIPASAWDLFQARGYEMEARIPGMVQGRMDGCLVSRFREEGRRREDRSDDMLEVLIRALAQPEEEPPSLSSNYSIRKAGPEDVGELASLYRSVFPTYPFPIQDPEYLRHAMGQYYVVCENGLIRAAASAEIDLNALCVELTDFATESEYRGQGLSRVLLAHMEDVMRSMGLRTAYTIARACSAAVNIVFSRAGYGYGGTLIRNTQICGDLESMNVWYKPLALLGDSAER